MGEEKKKKKAELGEGKKWVDQIIKEKEAWRRHQRQPISFFLSIYMADLQRRKKKTREREREKSVLIWCHTVMRERERRKEYGAGHPPGSSNYTIVGGYDVVLCVSYC